MDINFPSKEFASSALHALNEGELVLNITCLPGWKTKVLRSQLSRLSTTEKEATSPESSGKKFPGFFAHLVLVKFMTVHHFALARGLTMSWSETPDLRITYRP